MFGGIRMDQPFIGACVGEKLSSTRPTTLDSEVAQILRAGFHGVDQEFIAIVVDEDN
ncbi:hypothetical protein HMPREF9338_02369 [Cutibacterium acnes HL096PA2]|nr:hypothetical protein HMPREF9572_02476 [Cutibacterium acnes HL072PA1]EGE67559.1 hypothetical protein HMPREF9338_02369 [Cutibacterium acnes HL096PA2]EGF75762.1 hypothetical protein HMPREF9343_00039 [Cutibacterium acnes HL099PA1]